MISDFLEPPSEDAWTDALLQRWDVVPVVIQDPVWERSFPDVAGIVVPLLDPRTGRIAHVRMSRNDVLARREANERRWTQLLDHLTSLDLEPVVLESRDREDVFWEFLSWAEQRLAWRGRGW